MNIPTPHNSAVFGDIAKTVIMPGDPCRAQYIAENFLENAVCYNKVRGMLGYTGYYKGKRVSVQGHGMGAPSIGIYTYELFNFYDVDNIIRIGSAGSISREISLNNIVIALGACTDSNYASQYHLNGVFCPTASYGLLKKAEELARKVNDVSIKVGTVFSSDIFYGDISETLNWSKMGVMAVEMEAAALYMNAARAGKNALCMLTISDELLSGKKLSSEQRQLGFGRMIQIALDVAYDSIP